MKFLKFLLLLFALPGFLFLGPIGLGETLITAIAGELSWWYPIGWAIYWISSIIVIFHEAHKKEV